MQQVSVAVRVLLSAATLTACDELCICKAADLARFTYSHECRAQLPPGSHCRLAKPSHTGSNWASGVGRRVHSPHTVGPLEYTYPDNTYSPASRVPVRVRN